MCWMVRKVQRSCHHPCNMSLCAEPPSSWSPGLVRPMAGRPVVRFPDMAISFFIVRFRGCKSGLRAISFLAFSFSVLSFPFVLGIILAFDEPFLPFFPLDHQAESSSDHHSGSCTCSSPKNALPAFLDLPLLFPCAFSFSSLHVILIVVPCPKALITFNQQCLARRLLHLWPIVQSRLQHNIPR